MQVCYSFFIGTTAEFIKLAPVIDKLTKANCNVRLIMTGQNNIKEGVLWEMIGEQVPQLILSSGPYRKTTISLLFWFLKTLLYSMVKLKFNNQEVVVIHGDTISTLMGAIISFFKGAKLAHIEAGLRSYNWLKPFPEEICRVIVSRFSDISYCPNEWAASNLKNTKSKNLNTYANTLYDSMKLALSFPLPTNQFHHLPSEYFIFVLHRQENLYDTEFCKSIIRTIEEFSRKMHCVLILHAPTLERLKSLKMFDRLDTSSQFTLFPRLPYFEFTHLLYKSQFIITDGGSNQEEAYYLGKPCLVLRTETERSEGLGKNVVVSNKKKSVIKDFLENYNKYHFSFEEDFLSPSNIIIEDLKGIQ